MDQKIRVMFMQSQEFFGSDSMIHSLLMRNFDRDRVEVHVACNQGKHGRPSASLQALRQIPDLHLRPTNFGPTLTDLPRAQRVKGALLQGPLGVADLTRLAWYMRQHGIQIIHGTEKPRDAFYGLLLARMTGAKHIVHLHVKCEGWISPMVQWSMRHGDAIIGVSDFVKQSAIAFGYPEQKVHYVLNGIDASRWDWTTSGAAVRQEFDIAPDMPLLSVISRLFHWKGHTELLKALAIVKEANPRFRLLIVGEDDSRGAPRRGSYTAELKQLTQVLALSEQVIFTGFRRDVQQLLAATDIYTMPSFEEPCAVAYLEAMAMRKPIVALDSGGTPQLVDQGKAGLLSAPQDISQLAQNVLALLDDPELRARMGVYARERVEEYFTPQRMANDVERVYRKLLDVTTQFEAHAVQPEETAVL
ncbi:MAG TPA: glycosyltransferase family 4 protein [Ktedonobacterales bacterium]|nr:glycosyltransferase family 4 protein [Ktedonobacterales bacterium]